MRNYIVQWKRAHVAGAVGRLRRACRSPREHVEPTELADDAHGNRSLPMNYIFRHGCREIELFHAAPIEFKMQANENYYGFYSFKSLCSPRTERIEEKVPLSMKAVLRSIDFEGNLTSRRRPRRPVDRFLRHGPRYLTINLKSSERSFHAERRN